MSAPTCLALRRVFLAVLVCFPVLSLTTCAGPAGAQETYRPPVEGPVTDPFRPPPRPWMAGNRGVEFAPAAGTPVVSASAGTVSFAGPVAGSLHVTVTHPDGLRTSYSFLATITVARGARVEGGTVVGTSGTLLHWGARDAGGDYLDPMSLLSSPLGAVLVPGGDDGALPATGEQRSVLERTVRDVTARHGSAPGRSANHDPKPPGRVTQLLETLRSVLVDGLSVKRAAHPPGR